MSELSLILFDDNLARQWEPFALTRPVGELFFGTMTLRARAETVFGATCIGHLTADHLAGFSEEGAPPVLEKVSPGQSGRVLYLSSRFVPSWSLRESVSGLIPGALLDTSGAVVGWVDDGATAPPPELFADGVTQTAGGSAVEGVLLQNVWELIPLNPEQIGRDVEALFPAPPAPSLPAGVYHQGDHPVILHPTAIVEPGTLLDTSHGPIWLDKGATVRSLTRLAGPAYIGVDSTVLGGPVEAVSVGPTCRVRGELAESICVGYVNKQHDGHIGHAYLGRWVNLGAETTNSDLKNNYGTIRLWTPQGTVDTGEVKMGSLVGDHVKTGIGLLLNTGTVIGAGSNLYGAAMPPTYVPPFSWGTGDQLVEYRLDKFLEVAERAMSRRKVTLPASAREQLGRAWERGRKVLGTM